MRRFLVQTILLIGLVPSILFSEGTPFTWGNPWPVGAKAQALGGAFTGVSDDYTALFYNPAGLGQIETIQAGASFSSLSVSNTADYLGNKNENTDSFTKLHALGLVVPVSTVRGSLVFGFSYYRVRQYDMSLLGSQFVDEGAAYQATWEQTRNEEGALSNTSFGAAVEIAPGLYVGGAFNFWGGENDYTWQFAEVDPLYGGELVSDSTATDHVLTHFSGFNMTLSTLFRLNDVLRVGGAIQTPVTLKSREEWDYTEVFEWDDGYSEVNYSENGSYEYKIQFPWILRGGLGLTLGPVCLSADVALKNYNQMKYKTDPPAGANMGEANLDIKRNFRNVVDYAVGGELKIPKLPVSLLGGYAFLNAPFKNAINNENRSVISGGIRVRLNANAGLSLSYAVTSYETTVWDYANDLFIDQSVDLSKFLFSFIYSL